MTIREITIRVDNIRRQSDFAVVAEFWNALDKRVLRRQMRK